MSGKALESLALLENERAGLLVRVLTEQAKELDAARAQIRELSSEMHALKQEVAILREETRNSNSERASLVAPSVPSIIIRSSGGSIRERRRQVADASPGGPPTEELVIELGSIGSPVEAIGPALALSAAAPEMPPARTAPVSRLAFEPGALDDQNPGASAAKPSVPSGGQGSLHGGQGTAIAAASGQSQGTAPATDGDATAVAAAVGRERDDSEGAITPRWAGTPTPKKTAGRGRGRAFVPHVRKAPTLPPSMAAEPQARLPAAPQSDGTRRPRPVSEPACARSSSDPQNLASSEHQPSPRQPQTPHLAHQPHQNGTPTNHESTNARARNASGRLTTPTASPAAQPASRARAAADAPPPAPAAAAGAEALSGMQPQALRGPLRLVGRALVPPADDEAGGEGGTALASNASPAPVSCIAMSADGRCVVAGLADGRLHLWGRHSRGSSRWVHCVEALASPGDGSDDGAAPVTALALSGNVLLVGVGDGSVRTMRACVDTDGDDSDGGESGEASDGGSDASVGSGTPFVIGELFPLRCFAERCAVVGGMQTGVQCVAIAPPSPRSSATTVDDDEKEDEEDGREWALPAQWAASGGQDHAFCAWHPGTGELLHRERRRGWIMAVSIGKLPATGRPALLVGVANGECALWLGGAAGDAPLSRAVTLQRAKSERGEVFAARLAADASWAVCGTSLGLLQVWHRDATEATAEGGGQAEWQTVAWRGVANEEPHPEPRQQQAPGTTKPAAAISALEWVSGPGGVQAQGSYQELLVVDEEGVLTRWALSRRQDAPLQARLLEVPLRSATDAHNGAHGDEPGASLSPMPPHVGEIHALCVGGDPAVEEVFLATDAGSVRALLAESENGSLVLR